MISEDEFSREYREGFLITFKYLLRMGAEHDLAEDLAQEAWARAWEKQCQWRGESKFSYWVLTIAKNYLGMLMRRHRCVGLGGVDIVVGSFERISINRLDAGLLLNKLHRSKRKMVVAYLKSNQDRTPAERVRMKRDMDLMREALTSPIATKKLARPLRVYTARSVGVSTATI
jgi:DNA-directed RNA polymerase specialized sigma24 family protein